MRRILLIFFTIAALGAYAAEPVRFCDEASDTLTLNRLLALGKEAALKTPNQRVEFFGRQFIGTPYVAHTLEGDSTETLTVNVTGLDCTTFVETAMALAMTAGEGRTSWRDYVYNLRRLRYRGGVTDGYASRLHYIADWAADNRHRGNMTDVTETLPRHTSTERTIDWMSSHRASYPALADEDQYRRILSVEDTYRNHRIPYVRTSDTGSKELRNALQGGDIIALVSNLKNLDVTHMGMIVKDDKGIPHLLHASSSHGKVEIAAEPLGEFLRRNRQWIGIRVFRLL